MPDGSKQAGGAHQRPGEAGPSAHGAGNSQPASVTNQPSPAIVATSSHLDSHNPPRRFVGPMPEAAINSKEAERKLGHLHRLRKAGLDKLRRAEDGVGRRESRVLGSFGLDDGRRGITKKIYRVRVRRRLRDGKEVEEELNLEENAEDDEEDGEHGWRHRKSKKKRKDVWVGESFDIGREFMTTGKPVVGAGEEEAAAIGVAPSRQQDTADLKRPPLSNHTTQDTFVTARTDFSSSVASLPDQEHAKNTLRPPNVLAGPSSTSSLRSSPDPNNRYSGSSSIQPLIVEQSHPPASETRTSLRPISPKSSKSPKKSSKSVRETQSTPGLRSRLKSAIRKPSAAPDTMSRRSHEVPDMKAKTVQFPVDISQDIQSPEPSLKGNKPPADPAEVLEREGEEAAGTSHEAVEEALDDESEEEDEMFSPGQVLMRDRMLVRVAHHREDIGVFNEDVERKKPCNRVFALEEFIVVWRKDRVEFYQDWTIPLKENVLGHKHLSFVVPLNSSHSTLSIYNPTDVTLCLTTSASKLDLDFSNATRTTQLTRDNTIKGLVQQSKHFQWLKLGNRGTHVFIMKLAEKSRALDWYWELWRELGKELPARLDVAVPSLSTSIRLLIPQDGDMVGDAKISRQFNRENTIKTCLDMLGQAVDLEELKSQRADRGAELDLELAWKTQDGTLEWVAYDTTVQGKRRDWAVLVGLARFSSDSTLHTLQLRPASHQPRRMLLDDGTSLEEPPGIEGYLVRHKTNAAPKESVYLSTHDGNVFAASMHHASPPLAPQREGSTPADVFPEVHRTFVDHEHRRMAAFIERSAGCIDLRDITSIKLCEENDTEQEGEDITKSGFGTGQHLERSFEIVIEPDGKTRFEAHSRVDAKEWVIRLQGLQDYWMRRHRADARHKMDARDLHRTEDAYTGGSELENRSDEMLADIWDWCVIKGCRSTCVAGQLYLRNTKWDKFKARYMVLTGGCLVSFKVTGKQSFHQRKKSYPLFGAYIYSGLLACNELQLRSGEAHEQEFRYYQDGFQTKDGSFDTTFCVRLAAKPKTWGKRRTQPWENDDREDFTAPPLTTTPPVLLVFRARSKIEKERWLWAINAEMERQVRSHVKVEEAYRNAGAVPDR